MGATEFGFNCLKKILEMKENIVAIYTIPQFFKISWSKEPIKISTYKNFRDTTLRRGIPLIEVTQKIDKYQKQIRSFNPDIIIAMGWYHIIPKTILDIPKFGCVGIHASLLPKYRGGAPLVWAIINGEKKTGISFIYLDEKADVGDIIAQKEFLITKKDTIKTVYAKATSSALGILEKYIPKIKIGKAPSIKQDETKATYFLQRKSEDGVINWNKTSKEIYNFIRALTKPYPGAFFFDEKMGKIKVWAAKLPKRNKKINLKPGTIFNHLETKKMKIATKDGYIIITNWEIKE